MPPVLWQCRNFSRLMALGFLLLLTWSCAEAPVKPTGGSFYLTPPIAYLRESPGYDASVVGPLYQGDEVEWQGTEEAGWWQVNLPRSGATGWVRKELLSTKPVSTVFYYVNEDNRPLLECPRNDCLPVEMLYRGDEVQRVKEGKQGWWRVLVLKSRSLGWVPAAALTANRETARGAKATTTYLYVAVRKLSLRAKPAVQSEVVRTLKFNDQVQKLAKSGAWFKVRQPESGALGWVLGRDLETLPAIFPRGAPAREPIKPFKPGEEPEAEPEIL